MIIKIKQELKSKKRMTSVVIVFTLVIFFFILFQYSGINYFRKSESITSNKKDVFFNFREENNWSISLGEMEEQIVDIKFYNKEKYGYDSELIEAKYNTFSIYIEKLIGVNNEFYELYFRDKESFVESSYVKSLSAYPDVITNTIECPEKFQPDKIKKDDEIIKILSYAFLTNDRFTYGVCSDDLITSEGFSISIYCKESEDLYNIKLVTPVNDETKLNHQDIINYISCKK